MTKHESKDVGYGRLLAMVAFTARMLGCETADDGTSVDEQWTDQDADDVAIGLQKVFGAFASRPIGDSGAD